MSNAMGKPTYQTILKWTRMKNQIIPFYRVNNDVGMIPAGIDVTYRGMRYSTMQLIQTIMENVDDYKGMCLKECDWYDMRDGTQFNKTHFVKLYKRSSGNK
jgi:hypothetical protein